MAVSATYALTMTVRETLTLGVDGASNPVVTHDGLNLSGTLNAGTTVPATQHAQDTMALSGGAATIDLTSLTGTGGGTISGNGLKVQLVRFRNRSSTNAMTFAKGASNGYSLWTNWTITLSPGCAVLFFLNDKPEDIDATHKTIDVSGTGTDEFDFSVVMG